MSQLKLKTECVRTQLIVPMQWSHVLNHVSQGRIMETAFLFLLIDHRLEPSRLREEEGLHVQLTRLFTENKPQIWTGDFNALTREDYGDEEWAEIASIREKNSWESPQTDLTTKERVVKSSVTSVDWHYFPIHAGKESRLRRLLGKDRTAQASQDLPLRHQDRLRVCHAVTPGETQTSQRETHWRRSVRPQHGCREIWALV